MWAHDFCTVCDKQCPPGSMYCSESCRMNELKASLVPQTPDLIPSTNSLGMSSSNSSVSSLQLSDIPLSLQQQSQQQVPQPTLLPQQPTTQQQNNNNNNNINTQFSSNFIQSGLTQHRENSNIYLPIYSKSSAHAVYSALDYRPRGKSAMTSPTLVPVHNPSTYNLTNTSANPNNNNNNNYHSNPAIGSPSNLSPLSTSPMTSSIVCFCRRDCTAPHADLFSKYPPVYNATVAMDNEFDSENQIQIHIQNENENDNNNKNRTCTCNKNTFSTISKIPNSNLSLNTSRAPSITSITNWDAERDSYVSYDSSSNGPEYKQWLSTLL